HPAGQEQVRNLDDVIGMKVRQEESPDRTGRDAGLGQAQGRAASAIEEQPILSRLDQRGGPELLQIDAWAHPRAEQDHSQGVAGRRFGAAAVSRERRARNKSGLAPYPHEREAGYGDAEEQSLGHQETPLRADRAQSSLSRPAGHIWTEPGRENGSRRPAPDWISRTS